MISWISYATAGLGAMLVSTIFFTVPEVAEMNDGSSFGAKLSKWVLHSYPKTSYKHLPVFGIEADLVVRAKHQLTSRGMHRKYSLNLKFQESSEKIDWNKCGLDVEWLMPKDVFIDGWLLERLVKNESTSSRIKFDTVELFSKLDIESPSYRKDKVLPFNLKARIEFDRIAQVGSTWEFKAMVPDVSVRYQLPKLASDEEYDGECSRLFYIPPPQLSFSCTSDIEGLVVKIEELGLEPIPVLVPVPQAFCSVHQVTISSIVICMAAVLGAVVVGSS